MGIGYRIKEAREHLGLTQTELGDLVGVTGSAITNYEKEISHPKEPVMYKLIDALNVDANYLFQDVVKTKPQNKDITMAEYDLINKYRVLDPHGKEMVDLVLYKEHSRCSELIVIESHQTNTDSPQRLAAYSEGLRAAHNDHLNEEGELEKVQKDLSTLKKPK